jgi:hypothetical protein
MAAQADMNGKTLRTSVFDVTTRLQLKINVDYRRLASALHRHFGKDAHLHLFHSLIPVRKNQTESEAGSAAHDNSRVDNLAESSVDFLRRKTRLLRSINKVGENPRLCDHLGAERVFACGRSNRLRRCLGCNEDRTAKQQCSCDGRRKASKCAGIGTPAS